MADDQERPWVRGGKWFWKHRETGCTISVAKRGNSYTYALWEPRLHSYDNPPKMLGVWDNGAIARRTHTEIYGS